MRVAIYARTSKAEGDDETSIPIQLADCRERAEGEAWDVVAEYADVGISGWRRKTRPGYELLFEAAKSGEVEVVLCRDYERLLRNDKEAARWLDLYDRTGFGEFRFADEADISLRRARDRKDWKERVAAAVYYSDRLSEKVRRTKQRQIANGEYLGGEQEPFGYRRVDGKLEVDAVEAAVIHDVVARLHRGDSLNRIVLDLNERGITTSRGGRWYPKTLKQFFLGNRGRSTHLVGIRGFPRIVSDEEAAIARAALERRGPVATGHPVKRNPLVGLVYCGECGRKMGGWSGNYRCSPSRGGCGRMSIKATPLERYLFTEARRRVVTVIVDTSRTPDPDLLIGLREIDADIESMRELVGTGEMRPVDSAPILKSLNERREELVDRMAQELPQPEPTAFPYWAWLDDVDREPNSGFGKTIQDFADRWEARELAEGEVLQLRDIFQSTLERVTVNTRVGRGKSFEPGRVEIIWRTPLIGPS